MTGTYLKVGGGGMTRICVHLPIKRSEAWKWYTTRIVQPWFRKQQAHISNLRLKGACYILLQN